jgi:hypothetical protein
MKQRSDHTMNKAKLLLALEAERINVLEASLIYRKHGSLQTSRDHSMIANGLIRAIKIVREFEDDQYTKPTGDTLHWT